jgi:hypothetical protein
LTLTEILWVATGSTIETRLNGESSANTRPMLPISGKVPEPSPHTIAARVKVFAASDKERCL